MSLLSEINWSKLYYIMYLTISAFLLCNLILLNCMDFLCLTFTIKILLLLFTYVITDYPTHNAIKHNNIVIMLWCRNYTSKYNKSLIAQFPLWFISSYHKLKDETLRPSFLFYTNMAYLTKIKSYKTANCTNLSACCL